MPRHELSGGNYWSGTVNGSYARRLYFISGDANMPQRLPRERLQCPLS